MDALCQLSGTALARAIRGGEISSEEVVSRHIGQIETVNPSLNAVVCDRFAEALEEARQVDRRVSAAGPDEELPPFLGVPCTIKECFSLTGMPQTAGLVSRKGIVASEDASAVRRLREAGAIPLGVTNTSEMCIWMESANRVYGRTNNPYDHRRTVGGSSGGEGAIIGAGGVPFGLGSDIGGSIRMPAFFNGVFGHKATGGMVPNTGQHPIAENDALRYLCSGPLARKAEDLMPLLRVLAGPDNLDPQCREWELGDPNDVSIADLTVIEIDGEGWMGLTDDLRDALSRCAEALGARRARRQQVRVPGFENALDIWSGMMEHAADTTMCELLGAGDPINPALELARWVFGRSNHTLGALMAATGEKIVEWVPEHRIERLVKKGRAFRSEMIERMGTHGVLLYPSYPCPAPLHNQPLFPPTRWVYTAVFNILEFPVTQVPLGLNADGLPLGVQVVSPPGRDHQSIAVARVLEEEFGGWVPP